ncbi:unnamed protein product [Ranitomeya imitator]|uniref:Uncharacterized protein n=1 Tax=Ranitomeya imitator TaxID=111125 RepID=A0ABN9M9A9_9NEOB|nr:unnamed protein product [Ranitomeya imitator]
MERFFRSIKLKEWFQDKNVMSKMRNSEFDSKCLELRKSSDFVPPTNSAIIDAFERVVRRDIEEIRDGVSDKFKHPNVTREEYKALQELVHDDDIIIKPADKGVAVVIIDKSKYIAEINRQLRDEMVYQKLDSDPKFGIMGEINDCLKEAFENKIIDQELMNYLSLEFPRTPVLYITPKIHNSLVDPPGRPIVSGVDSVFSRIGTFLDKILNSIAKKSKSYIKDTTDFLNKLELIKLEGEVILASFDVILFYTSIEHSSGIKAVEKKLNTTEISVAGWESRGIQTLDQLVGNGTLKSFNKLQKEFGLPHGLFFRYLQLKGKYRVTKHGPALPGDFGIVKDSFNDAEVVPLIVGRWRELSV